VLPTTMRIPSSSITTVSTRAFNIEFIDVPPWMDGRFARTA